MKQRTSGDAKNADADNGTAIVSALEVSVLKLSATRNRSKATVEVARS